MVRYLQKEGFYPKFGFCNEAGEIFIGDWLPKRVQAFIFFHEAYHADKGFGFWKELKANWNGMLNEPIGGIYTLWLSISSLDRWKYYISRFREGK
jgi:hypothetical protein